MWKFSDKNFDMFYISAQNIDWGYSLEPPRWFQRLSVPSIDTYKIFFPMQTSRLYFQHTRMGRWKFQIRTSLLYTNPQILIDSSNLYFDDTLN